MTGTTIRAARWTYLSTVITAALQIVVTAVLARLLTPDAFGLVAMAGLVLRFGQYFAQMGVGQALVQRPELDGDHVTAGFWASIVIGGAFTLIAWLAAPLAASAFDAPNLVVILRWMSLSFLVVGTSTTSLAVLRRGMRFREIATTEIIAYVIGYGGALVLAFAGAGVWALVFAGLAQAVVAALSYNVIVRVVRVPVRRWRPYRDLLGFGGTVSVISFLEFLTANLDTMAVGRFAGSANLGFYNRALSLTGLPMQYMSTSLSRVVMPSLSRIQTEMARVGRAYRTLMEVFAGIGLPVALGMSGAASEIVAVMLGPKWAPSVPVMRVVAVASVAGMLAHFGGVLLEATARLREKLVLNAGQIVLFVVLLLLLARFGLIGYATAFALSQAAFLVAQTIVVLRATSLGLGELARAYVPGVVGGLVAWILLYLESRGAAALGIPAGIALTVQVLSGFVVLVAEALLIQRGHLYTVLREHLTRPARGPIAWAIGFADIVTGFEPSTVAP